MAGRNCRFGTGRVMSETVMATVWGRRCYPDFASLPEAPDLALIIIPAERVLPARAVFVFGYADATGLQMDLIELLLRRCGARVYLDQPADPDEPTRPDPGVAFSDRFNARMRGAVGVETPDPCASRWRRGWRGPISWCWSAAPQSAVRR